MFNGILNNIFGRIDGMLSEFFSFPHHLSSSLFNPPYNIGRHALNLPTGINVDLLPCVMNMFFYSGAGVFDFRNGIASYFLCLSSQPFPKLCRGMSRLTNNISSSLNGVCFKLLSSLVHCAL